VNGGESVSPKTDKPAAAAAAAAAES